MKTESPQFLPLDSETIRDASGRDVPVADRLAECDEEMIALSTMEGDFLSNVAAVLPGVTPPGGAKSAGEAGPSDLPAVQA